MTPEIDGQIDALERRADAIQGNLLSIASRPFVIEFAGTPKSGKSTSVEAVRHFFSRHGYRVHVLVERASVCPAPMKGHMFFNTWCAATMLAELVANIDTEADVIIIDRGLFDALVWLTLQRQREELTADEAQIIESFLLLDRWRSLIDLAVVMNVSAEKALDRETAQRISVKTGSIMNEEVLSTLSSSVATAVQEYGPKFKSIIKFDTSDKDVKQSNIALAERILNSFEQFLNPDILILPRTEVENLTVNNGGAFTEEAKEEFVDCVLNFGRFVERVQAEVDAEIVQVISYGVLTYKKECFYLSEKNEIRNIDYMVK